MTKVFFILLYIGIGIYYGYTPSKYNTIILLSRLFYIHLRSDSLTLFITKLLIKRNVYLPRPKINK